MKPPSQANTRRRTPPLRFDKKLVLNQWLISLFGIVGAAVATTISMVVWNVLLVLAVRSKLGINPLVQW